MKKHYSTDIFAPFEIYVGFDKFLKNYEQMLHSNSKFQVSKAEEILAVVEKHPELKNGFSDLNLLDTYKDEIKFILQDAFSDVLTTNEIKTASVPFYDFIFNTSTRFENIIKNAGDDFQPYIAYSSDEERYIIACSIVLTFFYGYEVNFKRPFLYQIPDQNKIIRYYKVLFNANFVEIHKKENTPEITSADVDLLLDNFDDIELWKEKFPPNSYIFKGFIISNIFDITDSQSISNLKSTLISKEKPSDTAMVENFHHVFRSLLNIADVEVGFTVFNKDSNKLETIHGQQIKSFLLDQKDYDDCMNCLCGWSFDRIFNKNNYVSFANIDQAFDQAKGKSPLLNSLKNQGIKSCILAPIANADTFLGVLELVSKTPKVLNSINANKLNDVMPFIVSAVERSQEEEENIIEAIIQHECTSIHPSVFWKFKNEAKRFLRRQILNENPVFRKIAFKNVYPLYGQIDIKGSSEARNWATKQDLTLQIETAKGVLLEVQSLNPLPIYEQHLFQLDNCLKEIEESFQVDSEQVITSSLKKNIHPLFEHLKNTPRLLKIVNTYFDKIDPKLEILYENRKAYDKTIAQVNKKMAGLLDKKQVEAQAMYPHFFERFKTDGVEHNMYIGASIAENRPFDPLYLSNLRLWQLQVMCEMENTYYQMQPSFEIGLDVASMVLVFNSPLTISFRMDEKQFDVDGTYNARYEIVKKRVDKAHIKGTNERITQKGKLTIVYSQKQDEKEYLNYISFLQAKNYLDQDIEILELEDLQAVTGLKAIRVPILYQKHLDADKLYTYNDLMQVLGE